MIYYLYWFVVFLVIIGTIGSLTKYSLVKKTLAQAVGYVLGTLLREGTFILFLVLVYPVLKFIN